MHLAELGLLRHQHRLAVLRLARSALRLLLRRVARLVELRRVLVHRLRRRRIGRLGHGLRRHFDLRLDHGLLATLRRGCLLVRARALDVVLAARAIGRSGTRTAARTAATACGTAARAAAPTGTARAATLTGPTLAHRTET